MVKVYATNISDLPDPSETPESMAGLPAERREKILRYKFAQDRKQSLGAGLLLKKVLDIRGLSSENVTYGENGKPKADGIYFNISHSHDMVVCAVGEKEVGCDVEKVREAKEKIAERFFTSNEVAYLRSFDGEERRDAFFRLWTLKESYMKMTGEGLKLSPDQFEFVFEEDVKVLRDGKICNCFIKEYAIPGYKLSVCAEEAEFAEVCMMKLQNE